MANVPQWRRDQQKWVLENHPIPNGAIIANLDEQAENNSYDVKAYYEDKPFRCCDCGKKEVWTAKQQQWWYEVAKGNTDSTAIRCRACRQKLREEKAAQKKHMQNNNQTRPD